MVREALVQAGKHFGARPPAPTGAWLTILWATDRLKRFVLHNVHQRGRQKGSRAVCAGRRLNSPNQPEKYRPAQPALLASQNTKEVRFI